MRVGIKADKAGRRYLCLTPETAREGFDMHQLREELKSANITSYWDYTDPAQITMQIDVVKQST